MKLEDVSLQEYIFLAAILTIGLIAYVVCGGRTGRVNIVEEKPKQPEKEENKEEKKVPA